MEQLKQGALVVCLASILAGILQQMLPKKEQSAGIKLVVGLYIVLTLLRPAVQLDWSSLVVLSRQQLPETQAVDVEGAVAAGAEAQLRRQLQQALDSQAAGSRVAELTLDYDAATGSAAITGLLLEGPAGSRQAALETAAGLLGDVPVEWQNQEENQNGTA